jgi:hypothetical protein
MARHPLDVVLAAVSGGLRELLIARGETPPQVGLRAMVPVKDVRNVPTNICLSRAARAR